MYSEMAKLLANHMASEESVIMADVDSEDDSLRKNIKLFWCLLSTALSSLKQNYHPHIQMPARGALGAIHKVRTDEDRVDERAK